MKIFTYLLFAFFLVSCSTTGTKVSQDKLSSFVKGKTTYNEVVQQLGNPTNSTINSDGTKTITYFYSHFEMSPASFIPVVGLLSKSGSSENTTVILMFDKNSILTSYSASQGGSNIGMGLTNGQAQ